MNLRSGAIRPRRGAIAAYVLAGSILFTAIAVRGENFFKAQPGTLFPNATELGDGWEQDFPIDPSLSETDYRLRRGGADSAVFARIWVARDLEEARTRWLASRAIPFELAWKMEPLTGLGERAQFAGGKLMAYLHFVRGNVYVKLMMYRHPLERDALRELGRIIDARIIKGAGEPAPVFTESLDPAEVADAVREVQPILEEIAGRRFKAPPKVRAIPADELIGALVDDLSLQLQRHRKPDRPLDFASMVDMRARRMGMYVLGRFSYSRREVLLPIETFHTGLRRGKIEPNQTRPALRTLVAHELLHALQDQEVDLAGRLAACETDDARAALSAVIEGHAMLVQKQFVQRLGFAERLGELGVPASSEQPSRPRPSATPEEKLAATFEAATSLVYQRGPRFIERLHREGGMEAVWKALANPPTDLTEIN